MPGTRADIESALLWYPGWPNTRGVESLISTAPWSDLVGTEVSHLPGFRDWVKEFDSILEPSALKKRNCQMHCTPFNWKAYFKGL